MNFHCKFSKRWLSFKIQFKIEFLLSSTVRILQSDWLRAFLTMPYYKLTNHLLQFLNLYLHAKNQIYSFAFSWDIANLRILWFDWLWAFWLIIRELELSHIWDLPIFVNKNIFLENWSLLVFRFYNYLKKSEKTNQRLPSQTQNWQMDWRTRNGHLIGPPFTRASYKKILSVWMGDLISTAKPQYAKNYYSLDTHYFRINAPSRHLPALS